MSTMMKMATNTRIRAAILKVQEQFEAAGISLTKEVRRCSQQPDSHLTLVVRTHLTSLTT
jgi:hypothetical protein